jgi:hypothetical protein
VEGFTIANGLDAKARDKLMGALNGVATMVTQQTLENRVKTHPRLSLGWYNQP